MKHLDTVNVLTTLFLFLLAVAVLATPIEPALADSQTNLSRSSDWAMFLHDPQHSGVTTQLINRGSLLWQFITSDKIRCSAAVVNDVVYVGFFSVCGCSSTATVFRVIFT
jgi:hypothetical protein